MSIRILIVEDEVVIAEDMKMMLQNVGYDVSGVAYSHPEAIQSLQANTPDIILIDINLGGVKDGIDLADYVNKNFSIPLIYATSNTDPHTLEKAKKTLSNGYLLKPFSQDDLFTAIEIAIANFENQHATEKKPKHFFFVKEKNVYVKVITNDILWLKSDGNYTELFVTEKKFIVRGVVKNILDALDARFLRVHKSYVINLEKIDSIAATHLVINDEKIPIGKMYKEQLMNRLNTFT